MASIPGNGIVLEPLTKANYDDWSCLVRNYLLGHGLWGVVNSDAQMGVGSEEDIEIWETKNAKALHIIQLACGSENLKYIRDFHKAREAWKHLHLKDDQDYEDWDMEKGMLSSSPLYYKSLHRYILNGEWNNAKVFLNKDDQADIFSTDSMGGTILHVVGISGNEEMVKKLVNVGGDRLLRMIDNRGYTALALVAELTGNTNIAKCMMEMKGGGYIRGEQLLLCIPTISGEYPVNLAAAKGHKEMTNYLFERTMLKILDDTKFLLFTQCINAEIFGVALTLLKQFPQMPLGHESRYESDGIQPLYALASMPYVFPSSSRYGLIQQFLYKILTVPKASVALQKEQPKTSFKGRIFGLMFNILKILQVQVLGQILRHIYMSFQSLVVKLSGGREIYNQKMTHSLVLEILNYLNQRIQELNESELTEASAYDAIIQAAKNGIIEFIDAMRKANPDLLWVVDKNKRGIFAHAIMNRRNAVFELIHDATLNGSKDIIISSIDKFGNTLLHLAANLGPSSDHRRSGPALQMQREILWFKKVEAIVHPKCKEAKNKENKKPREIFTESHEELMKAGEKWAKDTAASFTLVATLITTIMFAAAFTVPGGYNDGGELIFLQDTIFSVFIIADAISLFTSSTAVLLFIGILTARYAENDFLKSLPIKLLFGLIMLFCSVVSMMVAFCAALAMLLKGYQRIAVIAMSFACIPVIVLLPSQLQLFIEIFKSTLLAN